LASTFQASTPLLLKDGRYWRYPVPVDGSCPFGVDPGRSLALLLVLAQAVAPEGRIQLVLHVPTFWAVFVAPVETLPTPASCTYAVLPTPNALCGVGDGVKLL
jgi:hypothetical protein